MGNAILLGLIEVLSASLSAAHLRCTRARVTFAPIVMDELIHALNGVIPPKYQTAFVFITIIGRFSGELFSAIRSKGGLRGIYRGLVLGENVPKPISDEYRTELKIKPEAPVQPPSA